MTRPASNLPAATAGMISANGTTVIRAGGWSVDHSRNSRYAVVRSPGTATVRPPARSAPVAPGEHQRPAAAPQRPAAGQQLVVVEQPRQRGVAHLHQVELALRRGGVGDVDVGERHVDGGRARRPARARGRERRTCRWDTGEKARRRLTRAPTRLAHGPTGGLRGQRAPARRRSATRRGSRGPTGLETYAARRSAPRPAPPRWPPRSPPSPRPPPPAIGVAAQRRPSGGPGHRGDREHVAGDRAGRARAVPAQVGSHSTVDGAEAQLGRGSGSPSADSAPRSAATLRVPITVAPTADPVTEPARDAGTDHRVVRRARRLGPGQRAGGRRGGGGRATPPATTSTEHPRSRRAARGGPRRAPTRRR